MSNVKDVGNAALQVVIFYLLWFASCGLFILNIVTVLPALRIIAIAFGADQWTLPAVHRFSLLGLAVAAVIFFFWSEAGYRRASKVGLGRLLRAFVYVTGAQLAVVVIAYLIPRMVL
jgi:hypothetical protein